MVAGADGSGERVVATRRRPAAFRYGGDIAPVTTGPTWSADGKLIGLPGWDERAGALIPQIVVVDPASGSQRVIPLSPPSPVGVAWLNFNRNHDRPALHDKDKSHPTVAGSYLAACVFLAVLFGESPVGIACALKGLSQAEAALLQETARAAVG